MWFSFSVDAWTMCVICSRNVTLNDKAHQASYMVYYHIATKQAHPTAYKLILSAAIDMVSTVTDEKSAGKLKFIPMNNNAVSQRINAGLFQTTFKTKGSRGFLNPAWWEHRQLCWFTEDACGKINLWRNCYVAWLLLLVKQMNKYFVHLMTTWLQMRAGLGQLQRHNKWWGCSGRRHW